MRTIIRNNYDPHIGDYHSRIVHDEVRNKIWLFDCDGVYLDMSKTNIIVVDEEGDSREFAISQRFVTDNFNEVREELSEKQHVLTPGRNITIEDNVISAVGGGGDAVWGSIEGNISDQTDLQSALNAKVDKETGKGLSTNDYTTAEKNKLAGLSNYDDTGIKADIADLDANKVDKVAGKQLSTEDYTSAEKTKLSGVETGAEANTIETVKVNGTALTPDSSRAVDIIAATPSDLASKQDVLTAGTNIDITNNVISATDTTYTAGDNITITNNEISADVPELLTTTGQSTTAGMTQKAITDALAGAGGGGIKVLTTADYNYPVNNPDRVAAWLLDYGTYIINDPGNVRVEREPGARLGASERMFIVTTFGSKTDSSNKAMLVFKDTSSDSSGTYSPLRIYFGGSNGFVATVDILSSMSVVDNLNSSYTKNALSARQGKVLKDLIDSLIIKGSGAPTAATVGTVGKLYEDTTNGKLYQCTAVSGSTYTWEAVGGGGGAVDGIRAGNGLPTSSTSGIIGEIYIDKDTGKRYRLFDIDTTTTPTVYKWENDPINVFSIQEDSDDIEDILAAGISIDNKEGGGSTTIGIAMDSATDEYDVFLEKTNEARGQTLVGIQGDNPTVIKVYPNEDIFLASIVGNTVSQVATAPTSSTPGIVGSIITDASGGSVVTYMCTDVDTTDPEDIVYTWKPMASGDGTWGSITGTLSAQTDLQDALDAKQNLTTVANHTLYL